MKEIIKIQNMNMFFFILIPINNIPFEQTYFSPNFIHFPFGEQSASIREEKNKLFQTTFHFIFLNKNLNFANFHIETYEKK